MDNEHPSNNLNQANSFELIDTIEEMSADDNAILENFLREENDDVVYFFDEAYYVHEAYVDEANVDEAYVDEANVDEANVDEANVDEAYVNEVYIENNDLIIDQEFNLSQEIESQDQEYNTSHEMENPTNDQYLTQPNSCVVITLLDSDDEDTKNTSNEQSEPPLSIVAEESFYSISYVESPRNGIIFPGYNETIFNELKNFISNKTLNEFVNPSRDCGISKFGDLLRLFIPNLWLNDLIIQQYIQLLIQNCNNYKVWNLGSFFFQDIANHGFDRFIDISLKKKKVVDYNLLLIPAHLDDTHWALIMANLNTKKIYVYDSFAIPFESLKEKLDKFISFLSGEYFIKRMNLDNVTEHSWDINEGVSPLQGNSSDCGVFVCTNARYHLFNVTTNFIQEDIPLIRQRMSYELIHNTLLSTH